jgi:hypothetical protein
VIPGWYNDTTDDRETFSARAPVTHLQGDLIVSASRVLFNELPEAS